MRVLRLIHIALSIPLLVTLAAFAMFCAYYSMQAFGLAVAIGFIVMLVIYFTIMFIDFVAIERFDVQLPTAWFPMRRSENE